MIQVVNGKRFDWIQPIPVGTKKVNCSLYNSKPFSVSNGGFSDCKQQAESTKHDRLAESSKTQKTLTASSSSVLSVGLCEKDSITKADFLQALKVVEGDMSFTSTNGDKDRFKAMFPDSKIEKSYCQSEICYIPNSTWYCPFSIQ